MTNEEAIRVLQIDAVIAELSNAIVLFRNDKSGILRLYFQSRIAKLNQEKQCYGTGRTGSETDS